MSTGVYSKTAGDVVRDALRDASIVGAEQPIQAVDFARGFSAMNDLLAQWQTQGTHLWSETEAILPLNPSQAKYSLGVGGDHCFTDYVYTTTKLAYAASATSIDVSTTTGMTIGDFIGIELSSGSRYWTTIANVVDSDTVTITTGLSGAASLGASVYTYTTKIDRPLRIAAARYASTQTEGEVPIIQWSRQDYYDQPVKYDQTSVNQWYYSPQLSNGQLSVWGTARTCAEVLRFTFTKPQYVAQDQSEDVLIPVEWYLPLKWCVASELAVTYGLDPARIQLIEMKASTFLAQALDNDEEMAPFSVHP